MRFSFVSDLHLDASTPVRLAGFRDFLVRESAWCDELFVLGDLTEVWVGDDDDSEFAETLANALRVAATRCRISLVHGNRDFLIGERFATRAGVRLVSDPFVLEVDGHRILLSHGDALCTADTAYQAARATLRSSAWQRDVLARSLADRRALAVSLRQQSRHDNANKPSNIMDVDTDAVAAAIAASHADALVHGHTHRPGVHVSARGTRRYVLGNWSDRCGWSLRWDGGFSLQCFALARRCET